MQERYLGDVHDYVKFALLRHLREALNVRIGVNWYLTDPENNRDGGQRSFLRKPEWKSLDQELLDKLRLFEDSRYRTLENFEKHRILPEDTVYYEKKVRLGADRSNWHCEAIKGLSEADLVFLDQDNGFEVKSMKRKTHKYVLYKEAFDYYDRGQIAIGIQFAPKVKPSDRVAEVRKKLIRSGRCSTSLSVIRGRVTPNILFFTICPLRQAGAVEEALKSFAARGPAFKKLGKRVELIA